MSSDGPLERVLAHLDGVEKGNGYYTALCPAHDDHNPSLSVKEVEKEGQTTVLVKCWAGCDTAAVLEQLGLEWRDLYAKQGSSGSNKPGRIVAAYSYTDASGNLLHQTVRFEPKRFSQRRPDGKGGWVWSLKGVEPVLYHLPEVMRAVLDGKTVYVVEGEKDADRAREELGITATTSPMGAKKWRDSFTTAFRGANVVLIPDNDPAGHKHILEVGKSLLAVAASVRVLTLPDLPEKGDLSDWLDTGGTPEDFDTLVENAPDFAADLNPDGGIEGIEGEAWDPPVSLDHPPLPEFPVDALPKRIAEYVESLATFTQTPTMLASGVALGALATACAKKLVVVPRPGWEEPPQLWTLTLLESGNRKTAVMQGMVEPFDAWERAKARDLEPRIAEAESRESILTKRKKKAEDEAAKLRGEEAAGAENAALETARELAELEVLSPPQLIASDVTPEEAGRLCHDNDGRIALWSDEGEIFKVVAGRYSKNEAPNVETFLKGHAGADLRVNRVSREMVKVTKGAVMMVLVVQPEALASLNNKDTLRGLGYFARYLYGMPRSLLGSRDVDPPPIEEAASEDYRKMMTDLLNLEIPKDDRGEIVPHKVRFSPQADALLKEFQRWVEPQLGAFGEMAALKEWGSKLAGAVVRVAGLLHAVEHAGVDRAPWEIEVSAETLERAIEIGCCYLDHSRAVLASMGADPRLAGARYLVEFLKHRCISEVSTRDLFQKVKDKSHFETMDKLEPVLEVLEEYGYVRKRAQPGGEKGGRPKSPMLEINPLSPPQNPLNPLNPDSGPARAFFEWLERHRNPGDNDDLLPSEPSSEPVPNKSAPEESPRTDLAEARDSRESGTTGEEPTRKSGHEEPAAEQVTAASELELPGNYELVADLARLLEIAGFLQEVHEAALDIETTGLSPFEDRVRLLSLHAEGKTFLIDCFEVDAYPALEALEDKLLYVHSAEFDLPFLHHAYGFTPTETPIDTLHLSQSVRAGEWEPKEGRKWERKKHSLEEALKRELGVKIEGKKEYQRGKAWIEHLTEEHLEYAAGDVIHLKPLADKLFTLLQERDLEETWELEQRAKLLFLTMCYRGIPFDKERWDELADELEEKVLELKERADSLAPPHPDGKEWNLNGPKALQAFKLAELDVPDLKRETLSRYDHPLVKAVAEYRDAKSGLSRACKWYEGRYKAGRVHPHWHPYGAETGRVSCRDPTCNP